jgi:surface polysaccharide O-acyltransferase-like enzyme
MGVLFLVAGYFVPAAYDRKGFTRFVRDRLIRLGLPALLYMLIIHPFISYVILGLYWIEPKPLFLSFYRQYILSFDFIGGSGPLWFALALLIFSVIYATVRLLIDKKPGYTGISSPNAFNPILLISLIGICTFLIRLVQPIGTSILNMQLGFFAQYVILFSAGIKAYRHNWFEKESFRYGRKWLCAGITLGIIIWLLLMLTGGALEGSIDAYMGGPHWQSAFYALWESFVGVSMSIGLLSFFKEKINFHNTVLKVLSDNSFAVYVFHAPVIISIALLLRPVLLAPLLKFLILIITGIPVTFAVTHFIFRRIPLLNKII